MVGKAQCKAALQGELGLPVRAEVPLIGFVGQLNHQKGVDLICQAQKWLLDQDVQLVILGQGESRYEDAVTYMARAHPNKCVRAHPDILHPDSFNVAHPVVAERNNGFCQRLGQQVGPFYLFLLRSGTGVEIAAICCRHSPCLKQC